MRYGTEVEALESLEAESLLPGRLEHVRVVVRLRGLPEAFDGLRIGQITDLHYGHSFPFHDALLEWVPQQRVDLWAVTGDLYESPKGEGRLRELFARLEAPLGCFAVPGNNDNRVFDRGGGLELAFESFDLHLLNNAGTVLGKGAERVFLAGTDDPSRHRDDLGRALARAEPGMFVLLLSHAPDIVFRAAERAVPFVLAGHTHGGQIRLPWIGALSAGTRTQGCGRRMAQGILQAGDTVLYVSRGTGNSILPFRMLCPGEVTTITLRRREP